MTEYLKNIIHQGEMMTSFISKGVINPKNLVDEVIKNKDGFQICKVGKVIADFEEKQIIDDNLKKELIKKLQGSILETNNASYIVDFMMAVKGADIETIVHSLINKGLNLGMGSILRYIYSLKDLKGLSDVPNQAKLKRHSLLEDILKYLMNKKEYNEIINIINDTNDNEELIDIIIGINDFEFLNHFVNYLEEVISKSTDEKQKIELACLIKRINLPYRILYLDNLDLDSKFKVLVDLYNKGDMGTIAHYREEFAPLFIESEENKELSR